MSYESICTYICTINFHVVLSRHTEVSAKSVYLSTFVLTTLKLDAKNRFCVESLDLCNIKKPKYIILERTFLRSQMYFVPNNKKYGSRLEISFWKPFEYQTIRWWENVVKQQWRVYICRQMPFCCLFVLSSFVIFQGLCTNIDNWLKRRKKILGTALKRILQLFAF
jgi:hypothetical protein